MTGLAQRAASTLIPAEFVREAMERYEVPGVSVGVVHGDSEEVAGFGVTSVENPLPVDGDTLFQIGSITKTYTATAAMCLVEAGRLSLDEPVRTYLPNLRLADEAVARAVTMRHLLNHTGGWVGDYFASISPGDDALAQMVARLDHLEQLTPLGEVWSYNNAGFYLAGRVIEVIAGAPFEAALRELVLEPLDLQRSFFFADEVLTYRFAVGHDRTGAVSRAWSIGRPAAAAGGLIASVRDLLGYARLQWEPGLLLSPESLAELRRPQADMGRTFGDAVGLAWWVLERGVRSLLMHTGGTSGQAALLIVAPEDRFALAALTNHDQGGALNRAIQVEVLRSVLGVEPPEVARLERTSAELAEYVGEYDSAPSAARLTISDGELTLEVIAKRGFPESDSPPRPGPPPTRLAFEQRDAVVALDPPLEGARADFLRGANGELVWLRWGGRILRRVAP